MSLLWVGVAVGPIANDYNATHLFNPDWPRLHMMTVFTSAVALAIYGLYLCWGPAISRLQSVRLSAILGLLYTASLVVAVLLIPTYGGSMVWDDTATRPPSLESENFVVFISVMAAFLVLTVVVHLRKA